MPDASATSRSTSLVQLGRALRTIAGYLGAADVRPRQLIAGFGRHLIECAQARQDAAAIADGDYLEVTMRGLVPARIGTALVFLNAEVAEKSVEDLAGFLAVARSMADARIADAHDAAELTDALVASLDSLHSFLMAHDLVLAAYADATSGNWLDHALNALHPRTSDPDAYDGILDRRPPQGVATQRDLALAA